MLVAQMCVCWLVNVLQVQHRAATLKDQADSQMVVTEAATSCQILLYPNRASPGIYPWQVACTWLWCPHCSLRLRGSVR